MLRTEIQSRDCGVAAELAGMSFAALNQLSDKMADTAAQSFSQSGGFEHDFSNILHLRALFTGQTAELALDMVDVVRQRKSIPHTLTSKVLDWCRSLLPEKAIPGPTATGEMISAKKPRIIRITTRNPIDLWQLPTPNITERLDKVNEARQAAFTRLIEADSKVTTRAAMRRLDFLDAQEQELQLAAKFAKTNEKYVTSTTTTDGKVVAFNARDGGSING